MGEPLPHEPVSYRWLDDASGCGLGDFYSPTDLIDWICTALFVEPIIPCVVTLANDQTIIVRPKAKPDPDLSDPDRLNADDMAGTIYGGG